MSTKSEKIMEVAKKVLVARERGEVDPRVAEVQAMVDKDMFDIATDLLAGCVEARRVDGSINIWESRELFQKLGLSPREVREFQEAQAKRWPETYERAGMI